MADENPVAKALFSPVRALMRGMVAIYDRMPAGQVVKRSPERQAVVDAETSRLVLYHMVACPFCVKVRHHVRRLGLTIPMRDIRRDPQAAEKLAREGGQDQVPCLWIPEEGASGRWLYESSDINAYLSERFGA
jgi:glutaredoxin